MEDCQGGICCGRLWEDGVASTALNLDWWPLFGKARHFGKLATDVGYRESHRLLNFPKNQPGSTFLLGPELHFVDGRSCALQHLVIFQKKIYATNISKILAQNH